MNEHDDIMGKSVQFWSKPTDVNWLMSNDMNWLIRSMSNPNAYSPILIRNLLDYQQRRQLWRYTNKRRGQLYVLPIGQWRHRNK